MADLMQQAREQFEVWAAERGWSLSPARTNCDVAADGMYNHPGVQRCWEAWESAALRAAPEGYVLVPVEPTEEMHVAAVKTIRRCTGNDDFPPRVWRAMLAARPQGVR